ncbi:Aim18p KNAG_0M00260 [Huiozyma naganishii CBS 8797]|uniref:Altered inheritance of mitochondria protein 18, mitochondrial n=1 Tax=Huiozyma naganishii (strain ATCC MYA-139 / BCRC 22969 / CBS 8797 / KCTC 17520 / NBRC 10181 / NCYC 3082 / Yp74L-3) TaxID=1071383 RepID=J7SAM7_HUIN7|nr:hypothetical protein KNAG_0M00260 [Kazachstania naganishii CBS 8797]CCK72879.1 hypothetical protein KNAG_0M00260 [Kazachstania naganishii CBS 8797]
MISRVCTRACARPVAWQLTRTAGLSTLRAGPLRQGAAAPGSGTQGAQGPPRKSSMAAALVLGAVAGGFVYCYVNHVRPARAAGELKPFAQHITTRDTPFATDYTLLGTGVRSVTIPSFKVYAVGMYLADGDDKLVTKVFNSPYLSESVIDKDPKQSHVANLKLALDDPQRSRELVGEFIDSGPRLLCQMTPIINTNLTFVREGGFIKSLKQSAEYNSPDNKERVEAGIEQVRKAFDAKGSLLRNDDFVMELKSNGDLQFYHFNAKKKQYTVMGVVKEPIVGKILFRAYLSGPRALCEEAREATAEKFASMV